MRTNTVLLTIQTIMASFNPFTGIEKLIVEHGSSVVQGRYIELLKAEISILKEKFSGLESDIVDLSSKLEVVTTEKEKLYAENQDLKKQLAAIDESEEIDEQAYQVLEALFEESDGMTTAGVARRFQISERVAESHFDCLDDRGFVVKNPAVYGMGQTIPVSADISREGRAYIMAARKRVQS